MYTVGLEYYITGHFLGWLDNVGITEFLDVFFCSVIFVRLDALALSVIATATWLAGWLAGWLSVTAGIVSKRLNVGLSGNFFDHLIAPS